MNEPFLVINADDYYGKEAYREAYQYLAEEKPESEKVQASMIGFVLGNTLSENGGVTRGICKVDENGMLTDIVETSNIEETETGAGIRTEDGITPVNVHSPVSMNMWGLHRDFFKVLESGFEEFLENVEEGNLKAEYLLPTIIGGLLEEGKIDVKVLKSHDKWFGVTYKEDKEFVVTSIKNLVEQGVYPQKLF